MGVGGGGGGGDEAEHRLNLAMRGLDARIGALDGPGADREVILGEENEIEELVEERRAEIVVLIFRPSLVSSPRRIPRGRSPAAC